MTQAFPVEESRSATVRDTRRTHKFACIPTRTPYLAAPFWQLLSSRLYMTRVATPRESKLQLICGCLALLEAE